MASTILSMLGIDPRELRLHGKTIAALEGAEATQVGRRVSNCDDDDDDDDTGRDEEGR